MERHRDGRVEKVSHAPGDVGVIPAGGGPARWLFYEGEVDQLSLSLEPVFVEGVAEEIGTDGRRVEFLDTLRTRDSLAGQILLSLQAELEAGGALGGKLYAESLANALAVHLLREHSSLGWSMRRKAAREPKVGLSKYALEQALDFIGDNLASELSLEEIARVTGLSSRHFSRLFKLSTGLPPHRYVIRERVEKAKALLTNTEIPVSQVALACGFSHQAHLNRHFSRLTGTTPKKFRR
ncbi:MAG: helix-turn-helix transcriptional regulator [Rubrobacter sp.]|nr:helix-turn-helix transcriptional regulator [Rubrobacter sp.]